MTASSTDSVGTGLTFSFGGTQLNSFGLQLGDWGTCCYNSSLYIQFGTTAGGTTTWDTAQLIGTATQKSDVPEQNGSGTYTFIGAINDTNFFDTVRIYGTAQGDVLWAGGTMYSGTVALNSVPANAGSSTQAPTTSNIDTSQSSFSSADLGSTVNPVFEGGTLAVNSPTVAQDFTINDAAHGASSTIDQNGQSSVFSGVLSDASGQTGSITISNSGAGGSVTFTGDNTYTGSTTIDSDATLKLAGAGSIADSSKVTANGVLDISGANNGGSSIQSLAGSGGVVLGSNTLTLTNAADTFSGVLSGTGGLTLTGGTETLSGANTYTGATNVTGGTLNLDGSLSSQTVTVASGATLNDTNGGLSSATNLTANGTLTLGADDAVSQFNGANTGSVALNNHTLTIGNGGSFAGTVSGTGGLTLTGGTETLSGTNTYTGATNVNTGATLNLNGGSDSLASQIVTIASGATLNDTDGGLSSATNLTVDGTLTLGADDAVSQFNGANTGSVALNNRILTIGNGGNFGTVSGTGGLTLTGGTETLSGTNTYTGATNVTGGTLNLDGSLSSQTVTVASGATLNDTNGGLSSATNLTANGTLTLGADDAVSQFNGANTGSVALNNHTLTIGNGGSFAGTVSGTGGLTLTGGTETLSGTNTYTGATNVNTGATLNLNGGSDSLASQIVTIASGATLNDTDGGLSSATNLTVDGTLTLGADDAVSQFNGANTGSVALNNRILTIGNGGNFA
ncbi:beta strand repeat-containing protein [Paludibacterium denitrificans]|nr:autotransporter-associated beta strand repeat-containing protein [Paludibacterium denitrificans]